MLFDCYIRVNLINQNVLLLRQRMNGNRLFDHHRRLLAPNRVKPNDKPFSPHWSISISNNLLLLLRDDRFSSRPIRRFIHVDEDYTTAVQRTIPRTQRPGQSGYTSEDLRKMSVDYPELINYMNSLARDRKDDGNGIRMSRLYKAKEIQNDFRWEISFMYVGDYKYCERIKRHHQQNNI